MNEDVEAQSVRDAIYDSLQDDMVSLGEIRQICRDSYHGLIDFPELLQCILEPLLNADVEIGQAINPTGNYVEFVAWQGDVRAKILRLLDKITKYQNEIDFSVWLALRVNVDRYEF